MRAVASGNPASIAATLSAETRSKTYEEHRGILLGLAAARGALGLLAIPLAPVLYEADRVPLLVLLRPSKEVLLLAGFAVRRGDASIVAVVAAAVPLLLGGVWLLFATGRAYASRVEDLERSALARRVLPRKKLEAMVDAVCDRGMTIVFLGRLAAFPSTLVGAAAGAAEVPTRRFLLADAAGAALSMAVLLGAGYLLGETYEEAGPWLTAAGVAVLAAVALWLGRTLRRALRRT